MPRIRVNYKSDLPPLEVKFKINGNEVAVPDNDFDIRFYVDGAPGTSYTCSCRDGEYTHCAKTSNTKLTCYIDNHKFGCGRLCCEFIDLSVDRRYEGKVLKTVTPSTLDVVLVEGAGDDNVEVLNAIFNFQPNEIVSITTEESDESGGVNTVTITQGNGEVRTFGVKNGKDGEKGEPGRNGVYINFDSEEETPDFSIVDSLLDDSTTDALSANQGKVLKELIDDMPYEVTEYDSDDLDHGENGQYWILSMGIGEAADPEPSTYGGSTYSCLRLDIKDGDIITIATKGETYSRAWALTDKSRVIYAVADANVDTTTNPVTVTAEGDGYLYVNYTSTASGAFGLSIKRNEMAQDIAELKSDVEALNEVLGDFSDSFNKTYHSDALTSQRYWILSGGVGATVDEAPSSYNAENWGCLRLEVEKGNTVVVATKGSTYPRAWALTNKGRVIKAVAAENIDTTGSPVTLTVQESGFLYVNCNSSYFTVFSVKINTDFKQLIDNVKEDVEGCIYSPHYKNSPLPLWKDTLKVLAIGNSYTQDSTEYLESFIQNANIPESKLCLYAAIQSGATLGDWAYNYEYSVSKTISRRCGWITMGTTEGTLQQLVSQDWDVIILQQYSTHVMTYDTINPDLTKILSFIRRDCPNQKVAIAWHSVWSYKTGYQDAEDNEYRWEMICKTSKSVQHYDGIDIIIPTGTAIQNARNTSLSGSEEMTRDGLHLAFGAGRYIAAATWFQSIIAPMFNVSVLGNSTVHETPYSYETGGDFIAVNNSNKGLCQQCAFAATIDMWNITEIT